MFATPGCASGAPRPSAATTTSAMWTTQRRKRDTPGCRAIVSNSMTNWLEYHEEPVTLHSGGTSHWLVRGDILFANTRLREKVLDRWEYIVDLHRFQQHHLLVPLFYGIPTGGTCWAKAIAKRTGGKMILEYTGTVQPFMFVVDDVMTIGASFAPFEHNIKLVVVKRLPQLNSEVLAWMELYI